MSMHLRRRAQGMLVQGNRPTAQDRTKRDERGGNMNLNGKRVFTGCMQVLGGWEIRPFAIKTPEGAFSPCLSTRKHAPGSPGKVIELKTTCPSKEEAFELALTQGRTLVGI